VRTGPVEAIVICDSKLTSQILHDDKMYDKGGPVFDRGRQVIGNGLVTCPYGDHRRQRRLIQPAFSPKRIPMYSEVMTRCVIELSSSWREGQTLDVYRVMTDLTSDITFLLSSRRGGWDFAISPLESKGICRMCLSAC
jgi:cytochrome P450